MNTIKIKGIIKFDLPDVTNKHITQSEWKRIAMVLIDDDTCKYYSWFLQKRYSIKLNTPLRGPHISFINDHIYRDIKCNISDEDKLSLWDQIKQKYDGKEIDVVLDLTPHTDDKHWWLNIPHEHRHYLQSIRDELYMDKPFAGMHLTLGYCNEVNIKQSQHIHNLIKQGIIK